MAGELEAVLEEVTPALAAAVKVELRRHKPLIGLLRCALDQQFQAAHPRELAYSTYYPGSRGLQVEAPAEPAAVETVAGASAADGATGT